MFEVNLELTNLTTKLLLPLLPAIWKKKKILDNWSEGIIVRIPKKKTVRIAGTRVKSPFCQLKAIHCH